MNFCRKESCHFQTSNKQAVTMPNFLPRFLSYPYIRLAILQFTLLVRVYLHTIPLNCNFTFTCVILCGITTILQCIPVICLRGPRLLVSCNVHGSWQHICRSKHLVVAHLRKFMSRGNTCLEVHVLKVHNSHVITYLPSLSHYITPIFFWFTSTTDVMHRLFSIMHIKLDDFFSGIRKF